MNGSGKEVLWEKLARQAGTAAVTSVTQRPVGELRSDPVWRERFRAAIDEACAVAGADGVTLSSQAEWAVPRSKFRRRRNSSARQRASMWR